MMRSSRVSVLEHVVVELVVDELVVVERVDVIDSYFAILVIQGPHVRRSA